jgi:hypothetical protein
MNLSLRVFILKLLVRCENAHHAKTFLAAISTVVVKLEKETRTTCHYDSDSDDDIVYLGSSMPDTLPDTQRLVRAMAATTAMSTTAAYDDSQVTTLEDN